MSPRALGSRYLLDEPIGEGGMGVVWRARDKETGASYAIKVLRPEFAADPSAVARFVRERTALVTFRHPNVVTVHDTVMEGNRLALVMDLIPGGDLHALRKRRGGKLSPAETASIGAQICDGLAAAHKVGIVHRDLKPANILVDGGHVWLADFGIARVLGQPTSTTTGTIMGTVHYMAPEAISGEDSTAASDVYAVGITLYELLAGELPFTGHAAAIMHAHMTATPARLAGVPGRLWDVIAGCLSKNPKDRPTAAAAARALWEGLPAVEAAAESALPTLLPPAVPPAVSLLAAAPLSPAALLSPAAPLSPAPASDHQSERTSSHARPPRLTSPVPDGQPNVQPGVPSAGARHAAPPPGGDLPSRARSPLANRRRIVVVSAVAACVVLALVLAVLDPFKSARLNKVSTGSLGIVQGTPAATLAPGQVKPRPGHTATRPAGVSATTASPSQRATPDPTGSANTSPSHPAKPTTSPTASASASATSSAPSTDSPHTTCSASTSVTGYGANETMHACLVSSSSGLLLEGMLQPVPPLVHNKYQEIKLVLIAAAGTTSFNSPVCSTSTCSYSYEMLAPPGQYQIRVDFLYNSADVIQGSLSPVLTVGLT